MTLAGTTLPRCKTLGSDSDTVPSSSDRVNLTARHGVQLFASVLVAYRVARKEVEALAGTPLPRDGSV